MYIIRSTVIFLAFCLSGAVDLTAQNLTISGYIVDAETKETLIGASIFEPAEGRGVVSDRYGFFQFAGLSTGKHKLIISFIGYEPVEMNVELVQSITLHDIILKPKIESVDEVSVIGTSPDRAADRQVETSILELSPKAIRAIPAAGNDVFSAIKYLPGIDHTEPFSPLFSVRGGDPGENAVLLDGIMIYNPYHSSISSGIFNTQIIKSVDMLTGGFGAEYGGRNSSVMYLSTKDGNSSELHGEIEPSTFHSKLFLEFPVGKNGSAFVAGRYFFDIFSYFIYQSTSYFYDGNLSYTYRPNSKNRITFKYFQSRDRSNIDMNTFYKYLDNTLKWDIYDDFQFRLTNQWTNRAASVIHKWVVSPRVFLRSQVYYSSHSSDNYSDVDFRMPAIIRYDTIPAHNDTINLWLNTNSFFDNAIVDLCARTQINFRWSRFNTLAMGFEYNNYFFKNSAVINDVRKGFMESRPLQLSLFAENKFEAGPLIFRPGFRVTQFGDQNRNYEPRFNLVLSLPLDFKLRAAWGTYYQYVISMNTNEIEMNQVVDYYFPLLNQKPGKSVHYIAGIDYRVNPLSALSLDVYYKDIQRIYLVAFDNVLPPGSGEAYGAEMTLRGAYKNLSGWCSYGLSWADRNYSFLNEGKPYPYDYNRRHTVKLVTSYAISKNLEYNASFTFLSGVYRSIEQVRQDYYQYDPVTGQLSMFPIWISNQKNNAKMPSVFNLDISIIKRLRTGFGKQFSDIIKASESYLVVTIRNLTFFRRNVDYYFAMPLTWWPDTYLPIGTNYIPSVGFSYTIKF